MKVADKTGEKPVIEICPLCGSSMEKGFYIVPRQTWWDIKKHEWTAGRAEEINPFRMTNTNFEAYRCKKCKLILFQYGEPGNPKEDSQ